MTPGELHKFRSEAVPLIHTHLWLSKRPPPSPDKRPWTIARELSIWNRLVDARYDPEALNGAITVIRTVRPDWEGTPLRLTVFYWLKLGGEKGDFCATPFLEGCLGYWHKIQGGKRRERASLPPSVNDTLRRMISP